MASKPVKVDIELQKLQIALGGAVVAFVQVHSHECQIIEHLGTQEWAIIGVGATTSEAFETTWRAMQPRIEQRGVEFRAKRASVRDHNRTAAQRQLDALKERQANKKPGTDKCVACGHRHEGQKFCPGRHGECGCVKFIPPVGPRGVELART